ncbi:hypothetical protein GR925_22305 [Streptomyces sp. HUCO-GS316]|uniref:hypothetical protein n=1 Tax=Streptomyces sp. HUCO-GS316 TaxID=2692198 RepID=UPI00136EBFF8|nr:hypothetical protein [Streptomyces sp. HUCO-GS316]MXM66106.1 hypothetical protein [Streptomyces sp. HUCO-GS316]
MLLAVLNQLHCHQMEDATEDEVQLRAGGGKVWPGGGPGDNFTITENTSAFMQVPVISSGDVRIELWEEDWPDPDDFLGDIVIPGNRPPGAYTGEFTRDDAHYTLHYTTVQF